MTAPTQTAFSFHVDEPCLTEFLGQYLAIEDEQDRLREVLRALCEQYEERLPLRGVRAAIKIVRTREKLRTHRTDPMALAHLDVLEALVAQHLVATQAALEVLSRDAAMTAQLVRGERVSVNMATGEAT